MNEIPAPKIRSFLLNWYSQNKRSLPWRETRDPYAIWLSEIMLQQTTVETVIPYYEKFLKTYPTLAHVAEAKIENLLHAWQGLGYYNRIRQFQKAAQTVLTEYNGCIPKTKADLIKLSGLGDYTAGAVASIAFGEPAAAVDGNVIRVLSRLFHFTQDTTKADSKKFFRITAENLIDPKHAGDFNQALMDLGATICTPQKPACLLCPLREFCQAFLKGNPESLPLKNKKTVYQNEDSVCLAFYRRGEILIRKREKKEIMAGLWELPRVVCADPGQILSDRSSMNRWLKENNWPVVQSFHSLEKVKHAIMSRRMVVYPFLLPLAQDKWHMPTARWVGLHQIKSYPLTTITRKILHSKGFQKVVGEIEP